MLVRRSITGRHEDYRHQRSADNFICHTARCKAFNTGESMRGHDTQVYIVTPNIIRDDTCRFADIYNLAYFKFYGFKPAGDFIKIFPGNNYRIILNTLFFIRQDIGLQPASDAERLYNTKKYNYIDFGDLRTYFTKESTLSANSEPSS